MVPDTSMPRISLAPGGGGYLPAACSRSARLTDFDQYFTGLWGDVGDLEPGELIRGFGDDGAHSDNATTREFSPPSNGPVLYDMRH